MSATLDALGYTAARHARWRRASTICRRTWSCSSRAIARSPDGRPRRNTGRLSPAIRARSSRADRGRASLPRRARHRDRARSTRRRTGRAAWSASEKLSTLPATPRRSTRSSKARGSRNRAAPPRHWFAPCSRPTAASCASTPGRRSISQWSRRRSPLPTRPTFPIYARLRALLARSLLYTPDVARRLAAAHEALDLATEHGDPTLFAQVAPAVLVRARGIRGAINCVPASRRRRFVRRRAPATLGSSSARTCSAYNIAVESADHVVAARSWRQNARDRARDRRTTIAVDGRASTKRSKRRWAAGSTTPRSLATANLDLGMQIGAPDAFTFFAGAGVRHRRRSPGATRSCSPSSNRPRTTTPRRSRSNSRTASSAPRSGATTSPATS